MYALTKEADTHARTSFVPAIVTTVTDMAGS